MMNMNRNNKRRYQDDYLSDSESTSSDDTENTSDEDLLGLDISNSDSEAELDNEPPDSNDSTYVSDSDAELDNEPPDSNDSTYVSDSESTSSTAANVAKPRAKQKIGAEGARSNVKWSDVPSTFVPRRVLPTYKEPEIFVDEDSSPIDLFFKLFPKSLFMWIVQCTNERLDILSEKTGKRVSHTDLHEMILVIGCTLVMSYNRVPRMAMYFSQNKSLENQAIKSAIARKRFLLLTSKLYFNHPKKPIGADKTYYINELVQCLKYTVKKARSDSTFQSIDETMVKFKGRSAIKQFMPKKKFKRGVKLWSRSDAMTGYAYDFNVYKGKEVDAVEGTLGERVVITLCSTIGDQDVAICTDRFFTSYELMKNSPFACVGTVMANRKNVPSINEKLQRGESKAKCSSDGIIAFNWQDTKEVSLLSNCHNQNISTVKRTQKDGSKKSVDCPEAIAFYNKFMGGVDMTDQYTVCYDVDRKSNKWWKKVFQRLLMTAVTNSWILYKKLKERKIPLIEFLIPLAEGLIQVGKSGTKNARKSGTGRPSKKSKTFVNAHHMPVSTTMRRCRLCASKKIQKRTEVKCSTCDVPLCVLCFLPYHT